VFDETVLSLISGGKELAKQRAEAKSKGISSLYEKGWNSGDSRSEKGDFLGWGAMGGRSWSSWMI
jgi:hypothetical protein